jgi:transcriptional regulator with XRE-family HTH domain
LSGGVRRFDGSAFRCARLAAGVPLNTLAARLGVGRSSVSSWERGATRPTPGHLVKIVDLLDVTLEQLGYPPPAACDLAELRERAGLTVVQLAPLAGVHQRHYHDIESGAVAISAPVLERLRTALKESVEVIEAAWRRSRDALPGVTALPVTPH